MHVRAVLATLTLLICGCGRNIQNREAVTEGVMAHLKSRTDIDLSNMQVDVSSVSFRQNEADAKVTFRAKGTSDPAGSMAIAYTLEQKDGKWVVKGRAAGGGGEPHAPAQGMPPGHPPTQPAEPKQ